MQKWQKRNEQINLKLFNAFRKCNTLTEFFRQQKLHSITRIPTKAELSFGIITPPSKDCYSQIVILTTNLGLLMGTLREQTYVFKGFTQLLLP